MPTTCRQGAPVANSWFLASTVISCSLVLLVMTEPNTNGSAGILVIATATVASAALHKLTADWLFFKVPILQPLVASNKTEVSRLTAVLQWLTADSTALCHYTWWSYRQALLECWILRVQLTADSPLQDRCLHSGSAVTARTVDRPRLVDCSIDFLFSPIVRN